MSEHPQEQEPPELAVLHSMELPVAVEELAWQCKALLAQFVHHEALGLRVQEGLLQFVMPAADLPRERYRLPWGRDFCIRLEVRLVHDRGSAGWHFEQHRGSDEWADIPGTSANSEAGARLKLKQYLEQRRAELEASKPVAGPPEIYIIE